MKKITLGIRKWVLVASVVTWLCAGVGAGIGFYREPLPKPPAPIPDCQDFVSLRYVGSNTSCDSRSVLKEATVVSRPDATPVVLVKCVCVRKETP